MLGIKRLQDRLRVLEQAEFWRTRERARPTAPAPAPSVTIPVVDAEGEPIMQHTLYAGRHIKRPKRHTLTLQEAFDQLQDAAGVHLVLEQGADDSVQVYEG